MHQVSGFEVRFKSRRGWKAEVFKNGQRVGTVPVVWNVWRTNPDTGKLDMIRVWYTSISERDDVLKSTEPFAIVTANAKRIVSDRPHFATFQSLLMVKSLGRISDGAVECQIIGRQIALKENEKDENCC